MCLLVFEWYVLLFTFHLIFNMLTPRVGQSLQFATSGLPRKRKLNPAAVAEGSTVRRCHRPVAQCQKPTRIKSILIHTAILDGDDVSAREITAAFKRRVGSQTKTFRQHHEPSESDKRIFKWPATFYLCRRRPKRMKRNLNQSTSGR